jgi:hypothetical protein
MNRMLRFLIFVKMALFLVAAQRMSRGSVAFQTPWTHHFHQGDVRLGRIVSSTHFLSNTRCWMWTSERTEEEMAAIQAAREAKK